MPLTLSISIIEKDRIAPLWPRDRGFAITATPLGKREFDADCEVASARQGGRSVGHGVCGRRKVSFKTSRSTFVKVRSERIESSLLCIPLQFQTAIFNDRGKLAEEADGALNGSKPGRSDVGLLWTASDRRARITFISGRRPSWGQRRVGQRPLHQRRPMRTSAYGVGACGVLICVSPRLDIGQGNQQGF